MRRIRVAALCAVVGAVLGAASGAAGAVSPAQCAARANDTPSKLLPCIQTDALWAHMQKFQSIADANPGLDGHPSRNSGEPGYKASADYVAQVMKDAGYDVSLQPYTFPYYAHNATPSLREVSPVVHDYAFNVEWGPGEALGTADAALQPVGHIVLPPTATASSASGCSADDFAGFVPGRIALIQRGTCFYDVKVQNAIAAHASGVIVFNEGNPGRTDLTIGGLSFVPQIPVAFVPFSVGNALYDQYQQAVRLGAPLPTLHLAMNATYDPNRLDWNVIAESKGGDKNHVVVVDAHLDAIFGAGMLDNASGSATILEIGKMMKNVNPLNKLRFIWFGGEELGLLGSQYYVDNLSSNDLSHIGYDLDADVTATPNYTLGVLDPAGPDLFGGTSSTAFPNRVYKASAIARDQGVQYLDSVGKNHEFFSPVGTDAFNFNLVGIPASGVLTGQDCCKTQHEVDLFGGTVGNFEGNLGTFDGGCVDNPFLWCDNLDNNDKNVFTLMSRAFGTMVVQMAFDTKVMSSSGSVVYSKKLPIAGELPRHSLSKG